MTRDGLIAIATEAHARFDGLTPEVQAAYAVVDAMVPAADALNGGAPMWFGWALREAYLRGVVATRERCAKVCDDFAAGFEMVNDAEGAAFCPACRENVRNTADDIAQAIREGKE